MILQLLEKEVQWISVPESLLYALIGFIVTFLGISILIFFVWLMGKIMGMVTSRKKNKKLPPSEKTVEVPKDDDGVTEEVKVAIIAAIAAYYEGESSSCEFKVKRIRRL